jgi:hypothetical protein
LTVLSAAFLLAGCLTTSGNQKDTPASAPKPTEGGLYAQVPASQRADVKEAEFDLKKAWENVQLAEENVKLAELKKEQAQLASKYAMTEKQLSEILHKKAEVVVEVRKAEAVDNSGLGDKAENIKKIADLKTKELDIQSDEIQARAELDTLELKMKDIEKDIRAQEKKTGDVAPLAQKKTSSKKKK